MCFNQGGLLVNLLKRARRNNMRAMSSARSPGIRYKRAIQDNARIGDPLGTYAASGQSMEP